MGSALGLRLRVGLDSAVPQRVWSGDSGPEPGRVSARPVELKPGL